MQKTRDVTGLLHWGIFAREARWGLSGRAAVADDAAAEGLDADVVAGVGGRHPLTVADVDGNVGDGAVVEDQVARLQLAGGDVAADAVLRGAGVGEGDAGLLPGPHRQARAVEAAGTGAAVAVGLADLGHGVADGGCAATPAPAGCRWRGWLGTRARGAWARAGGAARLQLAQQRPGAVGG